MRQLAFFQHTLLDSAAYAIISTDSEGRVTSFNPAAEKLLGYTAGEVIGKQTPKLWHDPEEMVQRAQQLSDELGETVEPGYALFQMRALHNLPAESEWTFIRKDGTRVPVLLSVTPLLDDNGQFSGFVGIVNDLTGRKQIEQALQDSLRFAQELIEVIPSPVFYKDTEGRYLGCNAAFEDYLGKRREDIVGKSVFDLSPPELAERYLATDRQLFDNPGNQIYEAQVDTPNGRRDVIFHKAAFSRADGGIGGLVGIILDITERKRMEQALAAREQEFRSLAENLPDNIVRYNRDARTVYVNPVLERTLGDAAEKMLGTTIRELQNNNVVFEEYAQAVDSVLADGRDVELEMKLPAADGTPGAVHQIRVIAERDANGEVKGVLAIGRDITERKRMENSIAASEREYRSLAENLPDNIIRYNLDARCVYINPALERTLGVHAKERLGKTIREFQTRGGYEEYAKAVDTVLADGKDVEFELVLPAMDGRPAMVHQIRVVAERDAKGEVIGALAIGRDITERKRTERELELLNRAVNASSESVFLINEAGRFVYVNDAACKSLGYSRDELLHLTPLDIDPDIPPAILESMLRELIAAGPTKGAITSHHRTRDGRTFPVEISASAIEHKGAKFALTVVRDITERNKAEEQIRKLSQAVEQSPSSIMITDMQANIVYVNQTFTDNTGYMPNEVIGENPRVLQSGKTSRQAYSDLWAHLKKGETWRGEFINRRKDGSEYVESVMISPVRDVNGQVMNYLAIKEDITEKKRAAEREAYLAHFDQLTGLPNRTMLEDHFQYALSMAERGAENLAVVFLDLDHFKDINDTLGHSVGDQLLVEVAKRLKSAMREADTVSRMGGDEFIFILPRTDENGAAHLAEKLIEVVSAPFQIEQYQLIVTPSIGISIYPEDGANMGVLSQNADAAMYQAKQAGRNCYRFFTQAMQIHSARNLRLANGLRLAIARNQLQLNYQPQIAVQDGRLVGIEALLRWHHPELGAISPVEFIPIAEDTGLIISIGEWVLRTAIRQMKAWLDQGFPRAVMAVNLSAVQFRHTRLPDTVSRILAEEGLPPDHLEIELTEAVAMDDPLAAMEVMDNLHSRGIRMSIDDFGTGYSSLSYLKRFKVHKLKIDQSFVRDISDDPEDKAIVVAIINLASGLGIHTIAEGVETASQLAFLRLQGCDEVQGYYFSKPLPADEFEDFVKQMS